MQCNGPHSFGRSQHNPSSSTVSVVVVVVIVVVIVVVVVVVPSCCNEPHSYDRSQNPSSSTVSVVVVVVIVVVIVVVVVVFPSCCNEPHSYDRSQIPSTPIVFVVIVDIVLVLSPPLQWTIAILGLESQSLSRGARIQNSPFSPTGKGRIEAVSRKGRLRGEIVFYLSIQTFISFVRGFR